jgi:hypothetical protein
MPERTYTKLVPELGETCYDGEEMWLAIGAGRVLHLGPREHGLAHFGEAVYDGPDMIGWSISNWETAHKLTIAPGYRLVQVKRQNSHPGDMDILYTPLGDAFLFALERIPSG